MAATEIHGITEQDVRDAPAFGDVAPLVAAALSGAVFAAYNVYFDAKFIDAELARVGIEPLPPHLCLMYMRPLLGVGSRCSLADACHAHGVKHGGHHFAGSDALASAQLWLKYLEAMDRMQIQTFGQLARRKKYKFMSSFAEPPVQFLVPNPAALQLKSRRVASTAGVSDVRSPTDVRSEYWDALKAALADLEVTPDEVAYLAKKRAALGLSIEDIRALHARAFAGLLADVSDDHVITEPEVARVAALSSALRALGWSPGDAIQVAGRPSEPRRGIMTRIFGG